LAETEPLALPEIVPGQAYEVLVLDLQAKLNGPRSARIRDSAEATGEWSRTPRNTGRNKRRLQTRTENVAGRRVNVPIEHIEGGIFLISYFRGLSLDRAGQQGEAVPAFQEAIRLNPSSAEAHLELGKTELKVGRVNAAIVELEEALHLSPGNVQARRVLSQAYQRAGDAKRAAKYAETSAESRPATEGDLLGDFVLPEWQMPEESKKD